MLHPTCHLRRLPKACCFVPGTQMFVIAGATGPPRKEVLFFSSYSAYVVRRCRGALVIFHDSGELQCE